MAMRGTSLLVLAGVLTISSVASAMTLDDLNPGTTVHGPSLSSADLKGKVVFVEFWGTR